MRTRDHLLLLLLGTVWLGLPGCSSTPTDPPEEGPRYDGGPVSWHRDVLPIFQERCQGCHTRNGVAPFALETYGEASRMHAVLADSVRTRRMPPWMPAEGPHRFRDSRRLTQGEVDILSAWSEQGAPEGDPRDAPSPHEPAPPLAWTDLTIGPNAPYLPKDEASDDYHCFLLDPHLTQRRDLIGFEVMPGGVRVAADAVFVMQVHYNICSSRASPSRSTGRLADGRTGLHGRLADGERHSSAPCISGPAPAGACTRAATTRDEACR